ncbi:class III extradiol ring-cleavage dioxygenase [Bacillus sp. DTU_2020_1000418_1_SI_GHA_SEK_038]|uniref:DODA-type extradiol aromatic ring-opening family dioxygenase n=1 Tax=Bacillus sp. DTU_2020_1000418_1_SI_GHA_SEK_038 TaxID=3077585 RepID=UPI0028E4BDFA|nr:class III extradiol ring-cleavage dioxygenase [Bacillus sp. DTU_2020_1000418_1_SI_GHA_SEK_038]WNS75400.1 class III extradiol ring-cleavage dioxygenase [Bacillus sp. DTU_2020_1000418_1_SI_GHA_SEK_038]
MLPSYFIAHGAPLIAIETNEYTQFLNDLGSTWPRPKAIILFSAHWESSAQQVSNVDQYSTIYDFGGFSEELFRIQYPAKGDQEIAKEIQELFEKQGISYEVDANRGLDHGAWVVLRLLYPNADIPVISMSVNPSLSPEEQYKIGKSLVELRKKDVLIIGSGGTVHNLRALNWADNGEVDDWALNFEEWLASHLKNWDLASLYKYQSLAPAASLAVPPYGNEHFVPIFYAMGAADDQQTAKLLHRSYRYGNLSHSVWQFG